MATWGSSLQGLSSAHRSRYFFNWFVKRLAQILNAFKKDITSKWHEFLCPALSFHLLHEKHITSYTWIFQSWRRPPSTPGHCNSSNSAWYQPFQTQKQKREIISHAFWGAAEKDIFQLLFKGRTQTLGCSFSLLESYFENAVKGLVTFSWGDVFWQQNYSVSSVVMQIGNTPIFGY